ncbi:hypothetical protein Ciccas_003602 [Cichlidogyrus casuarinus]|uniref:Uncharacterized protein n=1 Tax=Cichlidogyrus casuarinus TaxID=1844966 RepID=A0ABD2QDX1_9PLAT
MEEENEDGVVKVQTCYGDFELTGRTCAMSAFSHICTKRDNKPKLNYFSNGPKTREKVGVLEEEKRRVVPILSSSVYGHYLDRTHYPYAREHSRKQLIQTEFYRRNGIFIKEHQ